MKTRYLALIRSFILCLVGMTMTNLALAACPANPNTDYGSRLILTIRDCTSVADEVSCAATTSPTVFYKEDCLGIELGNQQLAHEEKRSQSRFRSYSSQDP